VRLAAAGDWGRARSMIGGNEKAAVTRTADVINSGHRYRVNRRRFGTRTGLA
jgi:hypothetical protein